MKIDFHTHGKLAKKLPFSKEYTAWLFCEARNAGLDAICLTEHFNTQEFDKIYAYVREYCSRDGESYLTEQGLRIFPGMEVDIKEGGHTLVIGALETIMEMNHRLTPYMEKDTFLSAKTWIKMVKEYPVLFGAAHPYRNGGHIPELSEELLAGFDFIDLNGKDMAWNGTGNQRLVEEFAKRIKRPVVAGSDTHQSFQYGCVYNQFERECTDIALLRQEIAKGAYEVMVEDSVGFQVKTAGMLKRSLKTIHALGGDYVEVLLGGAE